MSSLCLAQIRIQEVALDENDQPVADSACWKGAPVYLWGNDLGELQVRLQEWLKNDTEGQLHWGAIPHGEWVSTEWTPDADPHAKRRYIAYFFGAMHISHDGKEVDYGEGFILPPLGYVGVLERIAETYQKSLQAPEDQVEGLLMQMKEALAQLEPFWLQMAMAQQTAAKEAKPNAKPN